MADPVCVDEVAGMVELAPSIDPGLYQHRKDFPSETVYEITTLANGLPFGIAIADIAQSIPHVHKRTTETYTVVQGVLEVTLGSKRRVLRPCDVIRITPGTVHSARSLEDTPARITVTSIPEWSAEDHFATDQVF